MMVVTVVFSEIETIYIIEKEKNGVFSHIL